MQKILPISIYNWLGILRRGDEYISPPGTVDLGSLRRLTPLSSCFGYTRGQPIDRYYVENFLARQSQDIRGRVLEIGDAFYTSKFGEDRITQSDVLHVQEGNSDATFVGDLTNAEHIPSNTFDCLVLTQTLHLIYDVRAALTTIYRILKPGGTALITFPGISQKSDDEWQDYWCWSFTTISARRLFEEFFPPTQIEIESYGNVLVAIAFLAGMAKEELKPQELDYRDPQYEVLITVKAVKPER